MYSFIIFFSFLIQIFACTQADKKQVIDPVVKKQVHHLGSTPITIKTTTYGTPSNFVFIQLHDNEETAQKAALKLLEEKNGIIISIENKGRRTISFSLKGKKYVFDPNRMFTEKGIRENLQRLGTYTPAAAVEVQKFATAFLKSIPQNAVIVAVHNNTDKNYSILSYYTDPQSKQSAKTVYRNKNKDADDFFITTNEALFTSLKKENFNVVLQNNARAFDDGSLSVYMGKRNRIYVNVEAEHGHMTEQSIMLEKLLQQVKTLR